MKHTGFISNLGRHNSKSFGKDIGFDKVIKSTSNAQENHQNSNDLLNNLLTSVSSGGIKVGEKVVLKMIDSALTHFLNSSQQMHSLSGIQRIQGLGNNNSTIYTTECHIGLTTTNNVKRQRSSSFIVKNEKVLANDLKDW